MDPLRLKPEQLMGPGAGSKAEKKRDEEMGRLKTSFMIKKTLLMSLLFNLVRASLSQKWIVPSDPGYGINHQTRS
jgi:hypothetical protein